VDLSSLPVVVLTRSPQDNRPLADELARRGVPFRELPCIATRFVSPSALPAAPAALAFPSRNAVRGFVERGLDALWLCGASPPLLAAVGPATADELRRHGHEADLVADPPTGQALAAALMAELPASAQIAVLRGDQVGGGLEPALRKAARPFQALQVYQNYAPPIPDLEPFPVAAVFVASPSAVRRLCRALPWMRTCPFLAIGPTTKRACLELGIPEVTESERGLEAWAHALEGAHLQMVERSA